MQFTKMHGSGNDYVVLDGREFEADWRNLAQAMCNRHIGVGADGMLLVLPSAEADIRMRMFNPDGSEGEMCGNGIRCLAKYVLERDIVRQDTGSLSVETMAGIRTLEPTWQDSKVTTVKVSMGKPELRPDMIPVRLPGGTTENPVLDFPIEVEDIGLDLTFVSMGNPHAVAFIKTPVKSFPLGSIGPQVESHQLFPNKVNFSIVNIGNRDHVSARVWERGAGETMACGTGACAIAVASRLHNFIEDEIDIWLPGGKISVSWDGAGEVYMEGPATEVFVGDWGGL